MKWTYYHRARKYFRKAAYAFDRGAFRLADFYDGMSVVYYNASGINGLDKKGWNGPRHTRIYVGKVA